MKAFKKVLPFILLIGLAFQACQQSETSSTTEQQESAVNNGIRWGGENETANYLSTAGMNHYVNIELAKAYTLWEHAVKLDSSLFAPHTMLSILGRGEKRDYHKEMAKKYVANENETSKLFVSLLDIPRDSTGRDARRDLWAKMHNLSNGPFIHLMYIRSLDFNADPDGVLSEADKLIAFAEENGMTAIAAATYNLKGYMLQRSGKLDEGTAAIEKYVALYDGYNQLDSRAEFYLFAGDTTNAITWYKKVVENYPFSPAVAETIKLLESKN